MLTTRQIADRFEESDFELRGMERTLYAQEIFEKRRCHDFWVFVRMSPKEIKNLDKKDAIRVRFEAYKSRILDLKIKRERVTECLHARHMLETRRGYILDMGRVLLQAGKQIRGFDEIMTGVKKYKPGRV